MTHEKPDPARRLRQILAEEGEGSGRQPAAASSSSPRRLPTAAGRAADRPGTPEPPRRTRKLALAPAFWTISSLFSMTLNVILIVVVVILVRQLGSLQGATHLVTDLLSGLYSNFEEMYQAHIRATIPVSANVPVELQVCIRRETTVALTEDVAIARARVTVQSGGLTITNALTDIRLPAGVQLPIALDLCVPVAAEIPVKLDVQTDIPIAETELGEPIRGLMDTIRPIYCLVQPSARDLQGRAICR